MLRHLLYEAASALMTRCRQPSKLALGGGHSAPTRGQARSGGCGTQARGDHAPHVGLREWFETGVEREDGRCLAEASFRSTRPDRSLDDGTGQSDTPPVNALRSGARAVRLDGRTSYPILGQQQCQTRTEARSRM